MSAEFTRPGLLRVVDPASGVTLMELAEDSSAVIADKVARARSAQPAWAARPFAERSAVIRRFRAVLVERSEELARLLSHEMGKPITQARNELVGTLPRIDFFLTESPATLADEVVFADAAKGLREVISHEPLGVIADISAWNYPYFVALNVIVPALLAGNAVVFKPSEHAVLSGLAMVETMHRGGVPADVLALVTGAGAAGAALVEQTIDAVFFTGSNTAGAHVAAAAGKRMLRAQLELGGKDPVYVCDDVDVAAAAAAVADGVFYNAGQSCCAVERIYVHRAIAAPFIAAFLAVVRGFAVGDPQDESTYLGPMARREQLDLLDRQVADAIAKGARLALGGKRRAGSGWYYEPTVLTDVDHRMEVMRAESFGPIIGIQVVDDDARAAALMADTRYGLTAGVYARDEQRARRILSGLRTGSVYWNCCDRVSPRLPWSGRGDSGIGSTLSRAGILAMTQPKAWHLRSPP